jgi:clan AA aspartic protease
MIEGEVTAEYEMVVSVFVHAADGRLVEFRAVVDSGFSDYLSLPADEIMKLGLAFRERRTYLLADNNPVDFDIYDAIVEWDGHDRNIVVIASDGTPLLGMQMLKGSVFFSDVRDGGRVLVRAF